MKTLKTNHLFLAAALFAAAISSTVHGAMDYSRYNNISNYDFEQGAGATPGLAAAWKADKTHGNATYQLTTSNTYLRTTAQLVSFSALPAWGVSRIYQEVAVQPGKEYYASSFVKVTALSNARVEMRIEFLNAAGTVVETRSTDWYQAQTLTKPTADWVNLKLSGTAAATAVKARMAFRASSSAANASGTFIVDAVTLSQTQILLSKLNISPTHEFDSEQTNPGGLTPSTTVVRTPGKSMMVQLRNTDPLVYSGKRAELVKNNVGANRKSYWYGFSVQVPTDWVNDSSMDGIVQWHVTSDPGEISRSPSLALMVQGDKWMILKRWDDKAISTSNDVKTMHQEVIYQAPINKGRWEDWVFEVKWDYLPQAAGGVGYTRVWRNGQLVVSLDAPNSYNDQNQKYFKIGLYKWDWNNGVATQTNYRKLYIDDVRITQGNGVYADVAP
ncbi:heparin lyase I family protein [Chitiniphilus purpureus]|uniref:Heparin lyase I family protein n=1 Tax=Chitiniphilus purpureus TaxID=2981137 RepID=A0ABY6DIX1_9NEIS|nr:heparin lyase I family protein [Chitiniphilus sp. CD1]UXY14277.1 heparin lyase I family protein [Chitiniphilus sp. CD1]